MEIEYLSETVPGQWFVYVSWTGDPPWKGLDACWARVRCSSVKWYTGWCWLTSTLVQTLLSPCRKKVKEQERCSLQQKKAEKVETYWSDTSKIHINGMGEWIRCALNNKKERDLNLEFALYISEWVVKDFCPLEKDILSSDDRLSAA